MAETRRTLESPPVNNNTSNNINNIGSGGESPNTTASSSIKPSRLTIRRQLDEDDAPTTDHVAPRRQMKRSLPSRNSPMESPSSRENKRFPASYEQETDPDILSRRQKQIDYGKNTQEYHNYLQAVPKAKRELFHPKTPNKYRKFSRRAWDGLIKQWRLNLHCWSEPPPNSGKENETESVSSDKLNDSFHSDTTSGTGSTSSSVAAAFAKGISFDQKSESEALDSSEECEDFEKEGGNPKRKFQMSRTSWSEEVEEYWASGEM